MIKPSACLPYLNYHYRAKGKAVHPPQIDEQEAMLLDRQGSALTNLLIYRWVGLQQAAPLRSGPGEGLSAVSGGTTPT